MKNRYLIAGLLVLLGAVSLVVYINKKAPVQAPQSAAPSADEDHSHSNAPAMRPSNPSMRPQSAPTSPTADAEKTKKINAFLVTAEIEKNFQLAADLLKGLAAELAPAQKKMMEGVLEKLTGKELMDEYKRTLAEKFSEHELERLSEIYHDKDVMQYHTDAQHFATPEGQRELMTELETFDPKKLAPEDREVLHTLAENQLKAVQGGEFLNSLSEQERKEWESYRQSMLDGMMGQLNATLKHRSLEQKRHLAAMLSDPTYLEEVQTRTNVTVNHMRQFEEAYELQMNQ
jgi:hypothetical protein